MTLAGDAYRQSGHLEKARKCHRRALAIGHGHAAATAKLKEIERPAHAAHEPRLAAA